MNEYFILIGHNVVPATKQEYNQWRDSITLQDVILGKIIIHGITVVTLFTGIKNPHLHDVTCTVVIQEGKAAIDSYHPSIGEAIDYHQKLVNEINQIATI